MYTTSSAALMLHATSFPAAPVTSQRVFRSDRGIEYFYDGTRWLSRELFVAEYNQSGISASSASPTPLQTPYPETYDKWIEAIHTSLFVASGATALSDPSHKWELDLDKVGTSGTAFVNGDNILKIASGASDGVFRTPIVTTVGVLLGSGYSAMRAAWTKTGTPGNLTAYVLVLYRLVG
jgi:hypothetical protein